MVKLFNRYYKDGIDHIEISLLPVDAKTGLFRCDWFNGITNILRFDFGIGCPSLYGICRDMKYVLSFDELDKELGIKYKNKKSRSTEGNKGKRLLIKDMNQSPLFHQIEKFSHYRATIHGQRLLAKILSNLSNNRVQITVKPSTPINETETLHTAVTYYNNICKQGQEAELVKGSIFGSTSSGFSEIGVSAKPQTIVSNSETEMLQSKPQLAPWGSVDKTTPIQSKTPADPFAEQTQQLVDKLIKENTAIEKQKSDNEMILSIISFMPGFTEKHYKDILAWYHNQNTKGPT